MEIIAIVNQKGGVGKSTTAESIASGLHKAGFKVLAVDMDPQRNLTTTAGAELADNDFTVWDILVKSANISEVLKHTEIYDLIPGDRLLYSAETTDIFKDALREALKPIKKDYDYIIIDTQASLNAVMYSALYASTDLIIPAESAIYSVDAILDLYETIKAVKTENKRLRIKGIVLVRYNGRTNLSKSLKETIDLIANRIGTKVFNSTIRNSVKIQEAQAQNMSIFDYAPKSNVAEDYRNLINEIIEG